MSRPRVTAENYQEVYRFYTEHEPSKLALQGVHLAAGLVYWPRVGYASGATERIANLLAADHRLFLASNHVNIFDQLVFAAAASDGPLKPIIGNTVVLAKQPYFLRPIVRRALDMTGAIPVYRGKDTESWNRSERLQASRLLFETVADHVEAGRHVFLFPEGTRNKEDPARLGPIQSGVGHMAVASTLRDERVDMVPMALWYGGGKRHSLRPNLFVGNPVEGPFESPGAATRALSEALAASLEMAQEQAGDFTPSPS